MAVLSKLAQIPASSPSSPFGKDSQTSAQKAGTRDDGPTGPATSKSPGNPGDCDPGDSKVNLLGPSVQLPARDPRMAGYIPIFGAKARESGRIAPVTRLTSPPRPVSFRPKLPNSRDFGTFKERP